MQLPAKVNARALTACIKHYSPSREATLGDLYDERDGDYEDFSVSEYLCDRLMLEDEWGIALEIPDGLAASFTAESVVWRVNRPGGASFEVGVDDMAPALSEARKVAKEIARGINQILLPNRTI